jgi:sugar/nucleoside kinase (ribokinase family)
VTRRVRSYARRRSPAGEDNVLHVSTGELSSPARTLCLGEALVDLICERAVESWEDAGAFVPHFGGAVANVAVAASRIGADVALAGGVGDDPWGSWLRSALEREGVDTSLFELTPGANTLIALTIVDGRAEAHYKIYGETTASIVHALRDRLEDAVRDSAALFISSNTLVGAQEREVTMQAREVALELGREVIFDPNLRLHRWSLATDAAAKVKACVPDALLVRTNSDEAALMTGEQDPERAALALAREGARIAVVTRGARGAILRGAVRAEAPGVPVRVLSTIGAGDMLMGVLLARLALSSFDPRAVADALSEAVAAGAAACERWGALD